jgi:hypothetical protein
VDREDGLGQYSRSQALALCQSEPLELYRDEPVQGSVIALQAAVPGLQPGQPVLVSGQRLRARLVAPPGTTAILATADGLQTAPVQVGESLILLGAPQRTAPASGAAAPATETWRLLNRDGLAGQVQLTPGPGGSPPQFVVEPPQEDDPEVTELAVIHSVATGASQTTLTVTTNLAAPDAAAVPLANIYERSTFAVRANVVRATHGSTVVAEVLGSSDGTQANQRFALRQAPLTYLSSATPAGHASTLAITVAGVRWHQVPFLYGHPRDERAYIVQHDEKGYATITFGDGQAGARLPSTREEVKATYRIGIGQPGNVPAHSLTQLRSAPPGLASVTNPLPAAGGVDPEADDSIRANAPLGLRAMHRIVSLNDYEDFARAFAGIGRVQARLFRTGRGGLLHLTIADGDGNPPDRESALYTDLVAAVERARVAPTPQLRIDPYESLLFDVALRLVVQRDAGVRLPVIEQQARQALATAFTFAQRDFAQAVTAAEIINLLQPLAGVVGVEITGLAYHGDSTAPPVSQVLVAKPARWPRGAALPRPAQLLLVNREGPGGITVDTELEP